MTCLQMETVLQWGCHLYMYMILMIPVHFVANEMLIISVICFIWWIFKCLY